MSHLPPKEFDSIQAVLSKREQTGRTTRMLEHAVDLSERGHAVYVIAADANHARYLEGAGGEAVARAAPTQRKC